MSGFCREDIESRLIGKSNDTIHATINMLIADVRVSFSCSEVMADTSVVLRQANSEHTSFEANGFLELDYIFKSLSGVNFLNTPLLSIIKAI